MTGRRGRERDEPPSWISLDPTGGDALSAERNGRFGLLIHGGRLRDGALRPTFGCLRVDKASMRQRPERWDAGTIAPGTVYRCAAEGQGARAAAFGDHPEVRPRSRGHGTAPATVRPST